MRGKTREANPKRRRSAPDDRAVLIAALVFSCEAALSSQRKIRGSRKRGYKKPQVSCTPFCPSPREGRVPARRSVHFPGCRPAAFLPPPKAAKSPPPSEGENPHPRDWGQPRLLRHGRRNGGTVHPLPRREKNLFHPALHIRGTGCIFIHFCTFSLLFCLFRVYCMNA